MSGKNPGNKFSVKVARSKTSGVFAGTSMKMRDLRWFPWRRTTFIRIRHCHDIKQIKAAESKEQDKRTAKVTKLTWWTRWCKLLP